MGETDDRYRKILEGRVSTERVAFFSDAVFAIAMTLLVIDIAVPELAHPTEGGLAAAVLGQWQKFMAYGISFIVIAINWNGHHRKFSVLRRVDGTLIAINLLLLFFIAFLPYPTSLFSAYPGMITSVVFYAAVVSIISLVQYWMWSYSYRKGMLDTAIDVDVYRLIRRNLLVVPVVFLLSIPLAFVPESLGGAYWAMYFWIINWPVSGIVGRYEPKSSRRVAAARSAQEGPAASVEDGPSAEEDA